MFPGCEPVFRHAAYLTGGRIRIRQIRPGLFQLRQLLKQHIIFIIADGGGVFLIIGDIMPLGFPAQRDDALLSLLFVHYQNPFPPLLF